MIRYILVFILFFSCSPLKKYEHSKDKWEKDIQNLEKLDNNLAHDSNSLLFVGSSSVRLWNSIANDMSPYKSIRRGYGGARYTDLIHFTKRLIVNHNPKAILVFVANDITGNNKFNLNSKEISDRTPKQVRNLFKFFVKEVRSIHKEIPILAIETTPTPKRWHVWDKISKANDLIESYCKSEKNLYYIDTRDQFILNDKPEELFFIADKLHLNKKGYVLWSEIIKEKLKSIGI